MNNWQRNRIQAAINGNNPMVMVKMNGGYATFGDVQFLPGYTVLLPKRQVNSLNDLNMEERRAFLNDMTIIGDALLHVSNAERINYEILGNTDQFLHTHIFPRYHFETPARKAKPVWLYGASYWNDPKYAYNPQRDDLLRNKITKYLKQYLNEN